MKYRQNHPVEVAAAKASISQATAYRIEHDPQRERGGKPRRRKGIPGLHGAKCRKMGETAGGACGERGPGAFFPTKANKGVQGGSTEMPVSGTKSVRC